MERILVSSCLLGSRVRYNGTAKTVHTGLVDRWRTEGRLVPFCPEVSGGLPVPREPA
ncbi:2-thiouracil desulfurase family protein, partial [Actinomadura adrarensis]